MKSCVEIPKSCTLCPRQCGADRTGTGGYCRSGGVPHVAWAGHHPWEEPGISGPQTPLAGAKPNPASGAVFFSGCSLGCIFCQNHAISRSGYAGRPMDVPALAALFLSLQGGGAHNLNLVTATHWRPWVLAALAEAKRGGLTLPVVWNTGGYETEEAVTQLVPYVNIWLFDVKYHSPALARQLAAAPDYWPTALAALKAAHAAASPAVQGPDGTLQKGVVLRVLVLPGHHQDALAILRGVAGAIPPKEVFLSLMRQYTPGGDPRLPKALRRPLATWEYRQVADEAARLGFTRGWTQGRQSVGQSYVPSFSPLVAGQ